MSKPNPNPNHQIAVLSLPLSGSSDGAVQLMPAGRFDAPRGALRGQGPWTLTNEAAARLIARFAQRKNDVQIDYEHQSLDADKKSGPVPAAGWIKTNSLQFDEARGLYAASVKWTAAAQQAIADDEYRYISPVFSYDAKTGDVLDLITVALTNNPAIDDMDPVTLAAARFYLPNEDIAVATQLGDLLSKLMKEKGVSREQLGQAAGIDADTVSQILNGTIKRPPDQRLKGFASALGVSFDSLVNTLPKEDMHMAASALKKTLGLADTATDEELSQAVAALKAKADASDSKDTQIAALKAQTLDPAKFVPVAVVTELQTQLAALTAKQEKSEIDQLIDKNLAKLPTPGLQTWARGQSIAALTAYLENAPEVAALAGMQTDGKRPGGDGLTGDALVAVCKSQWETTPSIRDEFLTLDDYTAYKKAEASGQIKQGAK
jgi:phage I-like protein